jgi:hypothetical protein
MYKQPYRQYWRALYPEYAEPESTRTGTAVGRRPRCAWGSLAKGSRLGTAGSRGARVAGAKKPTRLRLSPTMHRRCGR